MGGLGLRSLAETSPAAFFGGVEMTVPFLTGEDGICPVLEDMMGTAGGCNRWETFLDSNCQTAREFSRAWGSLRLEAANCLNYLGKELEGPLESTVVEVGGNSVDGSTRRAVTQQREQLRHEVITLALQQHPDREARPVTVFPNFDKLSGAWLLALPTPTTGLMGRTFSEAMAAHLCLPSPAVREWVGRPVGRSGKGVDVFGDTIMNCHDLPGDTWHDCHDTGKLALMNEFLLSKVPAECEVYGLFADKIPVTATAQGEELQWGLARQGLVPDY